MKRHETNKYYEINHIFSDFSGNLFVEKNMYTIVQIHYWGWWI